MEDKPRIFFKTYVDDAIHSGLIGDMGAERWQTLCVLASFMDDRGVCYPSQDMIAKRLNVARETANRRIQSLLKYKWQGRALVTMHKHRDPTTQAWRNSVYTIYPITGLQFGNRDQQEDASVTL
ncbi:helix-turn-helix domain-containing protein [Brevibacillus laterosporus]|uniref:helix-turn-helix domain-containing protein n=1 Tax=Brevibacillus laterosporus TaxID=1465 RepID=UPI003D1D13D9